MLLAREGERADAARERMADDAVDVVADSDDTCDETRTIVGSGSADAKFAYHGDELFPDETRGIAAADVVIRRVRRAGMWILRRAVTRRYKVRLL
jgi:hypothetical protein